MHLLEELKSNTGNGFERNGARFPMACKRKYDVS